MQKLSRDLRSRFKVETVRRYIGDLKRYGSIVQEDAARYRPFASRHRQFGRSSTPYAIGPLSSVNSNCYCRISSKLRRPPMRVTR
jgi:hypothetical protein